jgi:tRNA A37 methylthiotransferase MiaB
VIPLMAEGLITPYLDIPFQHAAPSVLKAMKRPANEAKVLERLQIVARNLPRHRDPLELRRRLSGRDRG